MIEDPINIAAIFFFIGTISFLIGALWNIRIWLLGAESITKAVKEVFITLINPRSLYLIIKTFIEKIFGQKKLYEVDKLRGIEKASFISFYVLLILANHIAADIAAGVSTLHEFIIEFFRSPFFPGYMFSEVGGTLSSGWSMFLFIDNLSMAIVLFFAEGLAIYRRFVKKYFLFSSKEDAIGLFLPVIWFIFRYLAEAVTIVKFGFPGVSKSMFISYSIAQVFKGLTISQIDILYNVLWPTSGFFLGIFFGSMPHLGRLWHAFAGPMTMLVNSVPSRR